MHRAEETIRRWIWAGKLPAHKLGGSYRVRDGDVAAVAGGRQPSGGGEPSLREWVTGVTAWRAANGIPARGGAGQLVIEDRAARR